MGDVIFRRIHGRIVPIKQHESDRKADVAKGSALTASGIGVAVAAGNQVAALEREHAHYHNAFRNFSIAKSINLAKGTSTGNRAAGQFKRLANKNRIEGVRALRTANSFKKKGIAAGGTLIAAGTHKIVPEKVKKEHPKVVAAASAGTGVAAAFGIRSAYYSSKKMGNLKVFKAMRLAWERVRVRGIKF